MRSLYWLTVCVLWVGRALGRRLPCLARRVRTTIRRPSPHRSSRWRRRAIWLGQRESRARGADPDPASSGHLHGSQDRRVHQGRFRHGICTADDRRLGKIPKSPNDWPKLVGGVVVSGLEEVRLQQQGTFIRRRTGLRSRLEAAGHRPASFGRSISTGHARSGLAIRTTIRRSRIPAVGPTSTASALRCTQDIEGERTDTVVMRTEGPARLVASDRRRGVHLPTLQLVEPHREDPAVRSGNAHHHAGKEDAVRRPAGRSLRRVRHEGRTRCTGRMVPGCRRTETLLPSTAIVGGGGGHRSDGRHDPELHGGIERRRSRTGVHLRGGSGRSAVELRSGQSSKSR